MLCYIIIIDIIEFYTYLSHLILKTIDYDYNLQVTTVAITF